MQTAVRARHCAGHGSWSPAWASLADHIPRARSENVTRYANDFYEGSTSRVSARVEIRGGPSVRAGCRPWSAGSESFAQVVGSECFDCLSFTPAGGCGAGCCCNRGHSRDHRPEPQMRTGASAISRRCLDGPLPRGPVSVITVRLRTPDELAWRFPSASGRSCTWHQSSYRDPREYVAA